MIKNMNKIKYAEMFVIKNWNQSQNVSSIVF